MTLTAVHVSSDDPALAPAFDAAQQLCRCYARGLYFASQFLPPHKRAATWAVLAMRQMVNEAIDLPQGAPLHGATAMRQHPAVALPVIQPRHEESHCDVDLPTSRLEMFRQRLGDVYEGRLELPSVEARSPQQHALYALAETVRRFEIPRQYFAELAEGRTADLTTKRYATWADLERHGRQTDGAVALILSCIFGVTNSDVGRCAVALGSAMRLTSILRDLKRDVDRGWLYLPTDDLAQFGLTTDDFARGVVNERLVELMKFQIARARKLYVTGAEGICWLAGDGSRFTASLIAVAHANILRTIERRQYDVFSRAPRDARALQLTALPRAWKLAGRRHDEPLPLVF